MLCLVIIFPVMIFSGFSASADIFYYDNGEPYSDGMNAGRSFDEYWEYTGVTKVFIPEDDHVNKDNIRVTASSDGECQTIRFIDGGYTSEYKLTLCAPRKYFFPGEETQIAWESLDWSRTGSEYKGTLTMKVCAAFVSETEDGSGFDHDIIQSFKGNGNEGGFEFDPQHYSPERHTHRIDFDGAFPVIPVEEKRNVCIVSDFGGGEDIHIITISEYTRKNEEFTVMPEDMSWVKDKGGYYDASVGVIEYHNGPILFLAAVIVIPIVIIVVIIAVIRAKKKKSKNK